MNTDRRAELDSASAGDQYGWLTARLADPAPIPCGTCGSPIYPVFGDIVPRCAGCHPAEAAEAEARRAHV